MKIAHLDLKECKIRRRRNTYNWQMLNSLISNILSSVIFFFAAWDIIHGEFTFGAFIAFNIIHSQGSVALSGLVRVYKKMGLLKNPLERYESVRNLPSENEGKKNLKTDLLAECKGDIDFRNVSFAYSRESLALNNINLKIPSGNHVALVGPSGSGKTTLVNLLLRLYQPNNGVILIDGQPLAQFDISSIRHSMAVVQQETFLFEASIRDNMTFGISNINDQQIWEALVKANAADFIHTLRGGLDAVYGTKGINFSGGQKQRLSIARIFLRDPMYVILDEATSSQDLENERLIQDALIKLREGRTTISIAHRLNTVANADEIYVLNKGEIIQYGKHDYLMGQPGLYRNLYSNMGNFYG
jgi:ABC-type multidrug transport system fused ATPase/permease subunit